MAWVILEVDADSEKKEDVHDIRVMFNKCGEVAIFDNSDEADFWLEKNNRVGLTYHTVEVWG